MSNFICSFNVSTKKNDCQPTNWLVRQERHYPVIKGGHCSSALHWEGSDLIPSYQNGYKTELKENYTCDLLKVGVDVKNLVGDRRDYAGYKGNIGINFRGNDLGELCIGITTLYNLKGINNYQAIITTTRGNKYPYNNLTRGEIAFIRDNIVPQLVEYVQNNKKNLYDNCIEYLEKRFNNELDCYRSKGELLKKQAVEVINTLKHT